MVISHWGAQSLSQMTCLERAGPTVSYMRLPAQLLPYVRIIYEKPWGKYQTFLILCLIHPAKQICHQSLPEEISQCTTASRGSKFSYFVMCACARFFSEKHHTKYIKHLWYCTHCLAKPISHQIVPVNIISTKDNYYYHQSYGLICLKTKWILPVQND